jgi:P22_AR N-terminal domain/ORF6C domain
MLEIIQGFPFEFYSKNYVAHLASDRQFYIRLDDVCDGLGIDSASQRRRIQNDEAIADKLVNISIDTPYQDTTRKREVAFLNLRAIPYWLGTIDAKRVKEEIRRQVILFKRDFAETAWFVYRSDILPPEIISEVDSYATPQERELAELMTDFRGLKKKVDLLSGRVDEELKRVGLTLEELGGRFEVMQAKVVAEAAINSEQAWLIQRLIQVVGEAMFESGRVKPRSAAHAQAQQEFKDHFRIHIYTALREAQLEEAIEYLTKRWQHFKPGQPLPGIFRSGHQPSLL